VDALVAHLCAQIAPASARQAARLERQQVDDVAAGSEAGDVRDDLRADERVVQR
jgi:hypothetical protein